MKRPSGRDLVELRDDVAAAWTGTDPFDRAWSLAGDVVRQVADRSTMRTVIGGRAFYVKRHGGAGWREILKNIVSFKRPVVDASNEYIAIRELSAAGLHTLTVAGYGITGWNPATRRSFLITEELAGTESLEQVCLRWIELPPEPRVKRILIDRVAEIAARMHGAGFVHQDFYICHLLLAGHGQDLASRSLEAPIYVVDLHRAVRFQRIPVRALVKDLGSLYFSALEIGLTRRDVFRFLASYLDQPLRLVLRRQAALLALCERRAAALHDKARRRKILPRQLAGIDV